MFQFTTTNVINSDKDLSTGKELWKVEDSGAKAVMRIKRIGNFKQPNVTAIYKSEGKAGETAKVVIDLQSLKAIANDTLRLSLYVGLTEACQDSRYSNDFKSKGKPFTIDFIYDGPDLGAAMAKKLENIINKYQLLVYGDKQLRVTSNSTFLVIEAVNEFQRFKKVNIEKYVPTKFGENPVLQDCTVIKSLEDAAFASPKETRAELDGNATEGIFVGKEGFGDYAYVLRNLRLPTYEHSRIYAINDIDNPIPGAIYDEYVLHYCVDRGILGSNAVGDLVKSQTTHVFYVLKSLSHTFETEIQKIAPNKVAEEKKKHEPYTEIVASPGK